MALIAEKPKQMPDHAHPGLMRNRGEALGQITWLFSQSAGHRELKIADLEWSVMPPLLFEQFRIFTFGPLPKLEGLRLEDSVPGVTVESLEQMPLGVAFWGLLSASAEQKVEKSERLLPEDWKSGDQLWLLELITPFATPENKLFDAMLLDMMRGPFKGRAFNLHRSDPTTGARIKVRIGENA